MNDIEGVTVQYPLHGPLLRTGDPDVWVCLYPKELDNWDVQHGIWWVRRDWGCHHLLPKTFPRKWHGGLEMAHTEQDDWTREKHRVAGLLSEEREGLANTWAAGAYWGMNGLNKGGSKRFWNKLFPFGTFRQRGFNDRSLDDLIIKVLLN